MYLTIGVSRDHSIKRTQQVQRVAFYLPGWAGIGSTSALPESQARRRRVFIEFDGVMANSDVWINGVHLGHRPFGYVSFRYELTASS